MSTHTPRTAEHYTSGWDRKALRSEAARYYNAYYEEIDYAQERAKQQYDKINEQYEELTKAQKQLTDEERAHRAQLWEIERNLQKVFGVTFDQLAKTVEYRDLVKANEAVEESQTAYVDVAYIPAFPTPDTKPSDPEQGGADATK